VRRTDIRSLPRRSRRGAHSAHTIPISVRSVHRSIESESVPYPCASAVEFTTADWRQS
jgi:hypothetical protein